MKKISANNSTTNLSHFETSSLPSMLMAAGRNGTTLGTNDEERLLILSDQRSLDEGQTSSRILLPRGATSGDDLEAASSVDYGHNRNHRRRQHRRGASKKPPKQSRRRIHSETDLRKMKPLIISPFMRTFGTQVTVNAGGTQQQHQAIAGHDQPYHERSRGDRCLTGTSAGGTVALPGLSYKQKAKIAMLAIVNFFSCIAYNCVAPLFQAEGLDESDIYILYIIFEAVLFFTLPLIGKYMAVLGSKRVFTLGVFVIGITAILFGFLNLLSSGKIFFWIALLIRCAEALGDACFVTSSFAISAKSFPGRIGTVVGIMETFAGLGFTVGSMVGSVLYEYGRFQIPFYALGMCLIGLGIISYYIIDDIEDAPSDRAMGEILKIPVIRLMLFAVIVCAMTLSFLRLMFPGHLASFDLSKTMVGIMSFLCGGFYFITAPFWGILVDRWRNCKALMLFGAAATIVALLVVGPSPMLPIERNLFLIGASLPVLGAASGALYIPIFQSCLDAVKKLGFDDSFATSGYLSGIIHSTWAFSAFFVSIAAGFAVDSIGFPLSSSIVAGINLIFFVALGFHAYNSSADAPTLTSAVSGLRNRRTLSGSGQTISQ